MSVVAKWSGGFEFRVDVAEGETLVLNSVPAEHRPGSGPSPMNAVEAAVAACTGMDLVLILKKMRKTIDSIRIEVVPTRRKEHPRIFTHLELVYHVEGPDLDEACVSRAVQLSQDQYCSVAAMLRPTVELSYRIVLNGERVAA